MNNPAPILELIEGFRRSKALFAAVSLGVFEGVRPEGRAIPRLLDACVELGLLEKNGQIYTNTPLADEYLCSSSPSCLAGDIPYFDDGLYKLGIHLGDAAIEGEDRGGQTFGGGGGGLPVLDGKGAGRGRG